MAEIPEKELRALREEAAEKALEPSGFKGQLQQAWESAETSLPGQILGQRGGLVPEVLGGLTPAGTLVDVRDLGEAIKERDVPLGVLAGIGLVPGVGDAAKAVGKKALEGARGLKPSLKDKTVTAAESALRQAEEVKTSAPAAGAKTEGEVQRARKLWKELGTASPYFQRWFRNSRVVNDTGEPLVMYHGTRYDPGFEAFDPERMGGSTGFGYFGHGFYFSSDPKVALRYTDDYRGSAPPKLTEKVEEPGWKITEHDDSSPGGSLIPSAPTGAVGSFYLSLQKPYIWEDKYKNIGNFVKELEPEALPEDVREAVLDRIGGIERLEPLTYINRGPIVSKALREELEERGYDGVIVSGQHPEIVAFGPSQIKSSSSNRGTFDPKDPRITYGAAPLVLTAKQGKEEDR